MPTSQNKSTNVTLCKLTGQTHKQGLSGYQGNKKLTKTWDFVTSVRYMKDIMILKTDCWTEFVISFRWVGVNNKRGKFYKFMI